MFLEGVRGNLPAAIEAFKQLELFGELIEKGASPRELISRRARIFGRFPFVPKGQRVSARGLNPAQHTPQWS